MYNNKTSTNVTSSNAKNNITEVKEINQNFSFISFFSDPTVLILWNVMCPFMSKILKGPLTTLPNEFVNSIIFETPLILGELVLFGIPDDYPFLKNHVNLFKDVIFDHITLFKNVMSDINTLCYNVLSSLTIDDIYGIMNTFAVTLLTLLPAAVKFVEDNSDNISTNNIVTGIDNISTGINDFIGKIGTSFVASTLLGLGMGCFRLVDKILTEEKHLTEEEHFLEAVKISAIEGLLVGTITFIMMLTYDDYLKPLIFNSVNENVNLSQELVEDQSYNLSLAEV